MKTSKAKKLKGKLASKKDERQRKTAAATNKPVAMNEFAKESALQVKSNLSERNACQEGINWEESEHNIRNY